MVYGMCPFSGKVLFDIVLRTRKAVDKPEQVGTVLRPPKRFDDIERQRCIISLPRLVLGGEAKGDRRRITKESDWRQKRGETKARMLAF